MLLLQSEFIAIVYSCWNINKTGNKNVKITTTAMPAKSDNSTIHLENFLGLYTLSHRKTLNSFTIYTFL